MKLSLQVAAGIIVASLFFWIIGMAFTAGIVHEAGSFFSREIHQAQQTAAAQQRRFTIEHEEQQQQLADERAERKRAALEADFARCTVTKADGTVYHCDPTLQGRRLPQ
jgi:hypothetical protein